MTDADVAAAEQEARDAEDLVTELENRIVDGDDTVTAADLQAQVGLSRWAKMRLEGTRRKADRAKAAARLRDCEALHGEILAASKSGGKDLAKLLSAVVDSVRAFHEAADARNAQIRGWRQRAVALGIPEHKNPSAPPAEHGRVGLTTGGGSFGVAGVIADRRRVEEFDPSLFLNRAVDLLVREGKFKHLPHVDAGVDVFADLAGIDAEIPESTAKHFYRGSGGGVVVKDEPFTDEEIARMGLVVITREEAYGE
ncbi:hypothetical protein KKI43_02495 [Arthrobacter sp. GN70]|uniref:Uncharacterized protein n=1 Tax=Arthrobacter terricola TaxID=2547396 RepID=A0A4R5K5H6_9MICC|nr:hypothetical protein [Arthrobacter sp. GN70]TDF86877.1 hypothetical protein E1809_25500 [Arthrobacter terricola]